MKVVALGLIGGALLAVLGGVAIAQQDKYSLKLGKLAFADFKGYENWGVVRSARLTPN